MAFNIQGWARTSVSANEPIIAQKAIVLVNNVPTLLQVADNGCFRNYNYYGSSYTLGELTGDTQAQMSADGYFNDVQYDLQVNDLINCFSPFEVNYQTYRVTAVTPDVTIAPRGLTRETLVFPAASIIAMNAVPVQLLEAPGANEAYLIHKWAVNMRPLAAGPVAYINGTNIVLQYDLTAAGGGTQAAGTIPATAITGGTVSRSGLGGSAAGVAGLTTLFANSPVYLSNTGTAFANGNGLVAVTVSYEIISLL